MALGLRVFEAKFADFSEKFVELERERDGWVLLKGDEEVIDDDIKRGLFISFFLFKILKAV